MTPILSAHAVTGRSIQLTRTAATDLDRLDPALRAQLVHDLRDLQANPTRRPPRIKRLRGYDAPLYRLRSGDYLVVYRLDDDLNGQRGEGDYLAL